MRFLLIKAWLLLILSLALCSCSKPDTQSVPMDEITVQLKWVHQAQFAGFYVAAKKDYYTKEHIRVSFLEGGAQTDISAPLISGKAQFGVLAPEDVLIKQSDTIPLVAIAVIYQRSAVVFLSHEDSSVIHPWDFPGKTVAFLGQKGSIRDFEFQFNAMIEKLGLDIHTINAVPYDPEYTGFLNKTVDVTPAYITGGLVHIRKMGHNPHVIWPGNYGIHVYSDTLVTTNHLIETNPDLVLRFLRASLKGWRDAVGDPEKAVEATMAYARVKDRELQADMMNALLPLVHTGEDPVGWMAGEQWAAMNQMLSAQKIIEKPIDDISRVYTTQFLNDIYGVKAP